MTTINVIDESTLVIVTGTKGPQGPKGEQGDAWPSLGVQQASEAARDAAQISATSASTSAALAEQSNLAAKTSEVAANASATQADISAQQASASANTAATKAAETATNANLVAQSATTIAALVNTTKAYSDSAATATVTATTAAATAITALDNVNAVFDNFDDRYLGAKTSDPSRDNDGNPINIGALYYNSTTNEVKFYNGTTWESPTTSSISAATTATSQAALASVKADQAQASSVWANTSATNASASATSAAASDANASASATNAATSASTATTKASEASTSATNAASSATASAGSATVAQTSASNAATSASNAATSATSAATQAANAASSATAAAGSATSASTSAGNAAGSAASALAIYDNTTAMQTAVAQAAAQASLAAGHAASAASVVQQDLSGVSAAALHRSPNAVTAMFVYDTSKDSDGGAWTERCQHTSWYNEPVMGKWLGAHADELNARSFGAITGSQLITNGSFDTDTSWTKSVGWSISNGQATAVATGSGNPELSQTVPLVAGKPYEVVLTVTLIAGVLHVRLGSGIQALSITSSGTYRVVGLAGAAWFALLSVNGTFSGSIDNISVREVISQTTQSGDYFQLTTDGKFYKLNATSGTTEVFRGNRREFPKLSAIVAEASNVTIYDLTEPGRPMWMRFGQAGDNSAAQLWSAPFTNPASAVSMLNGVLCIGLSFYDTNNGLIVANFLLDTARRIIGIYTAYAGALVGGLSNRNSSRTLIANNTISLAGSFVNSVAMTVLPDAPVDPVTGLQVPTIAVATNGGLSVIKHNGTVVNSSSTSSRSKVTITPSLLTAASSGDWGFYYAASPGSLGASFNMTTVAGNTPPMFEGSNVQNLIQTPKLFARSSAINAASIGLLQHNVSTAGRGVGARITNTFNTGHQVGDIRRTYLSDIEAGSVGPSTELVTNGDFSNGITGWSASSGLHGTGTSYVAADRLSASNGALTITNSATSGTYTYAWVAITVTPNKAYRVSFNLNSATTNARYFEVWANGQVVWKDWSAFPLGRNTYTFTAKVSTIYLSFGCYDASQSITISDVSLTDAYTSDRSYKSNSSRVFGTLTKTAVASAAQLVAYSGFSASNYLREPYSADLDFGTGEWTASAWVNVPVTLPTPTLGSELVTNGNFEDSTGWVLSGGWSISGGKLIGTSATNSARQNGLTTAGKWYRVAFDLSTFTGGNTIRICNNSGSSLVGFSNLVAGTSYTGYLFATGSDVFIEAEATPFSGTIDNFSIREVVLPLVADRSHSSGAKLNFGLTPRGNLTATAYDGTTTRTVTTTAAYNTATWLKVRVNYTTDGSLALLVNGQEVAVTRGAPLLTLNNSNAVLTIGNSYAADAPFPGPLALVKFSATVPTPEQSVWMYEQEKQMFREGAQCCLPDSGSIVDLTYDDATDKWIAVSAANESEWSGLVRTSVTPVPAGSYTKAAAASGVQLLARSTTSPGVDITIPAYGLREELVKRAESAARLARNLATFDYVGGFTANTTSGSTSITNVAGLSYPTSYIGAQVTGTGISAGTVITAVNGTTIYISKPATVTGTAVQISFTDFILPTGYEAKDVLLAGVSQKEGSTAAFTRLFDGFKETIRLSTTPSYTALIQVKATRSIQ